MYKGKKLFIIIFILLLVTTFAFIMSSLSRKPVLESIQKKTEINTTENTQYSDSPFKNLAENSNKEENIGIQSLHGIFSFLKTPKDFEIYKNIELYEGQVIGLINNKNNGTYNITVLNSFYTEYFPLNTQKEIIHCNNNNTWVGNSDSVSKISADFSIKKNTASDTIYVMSIFCSSKDCTHFIDRCYIHVYE